MALTKNNVTFEFKNFQKLLSKMMFFVEIINIQWRQI